jgi:hypothetical protein
MDDLQDMDTDQAAGIHSAVYYMLPPPARSIWNQPPDRYPAERLEALRQAIYQGGIVDALKNKIAQALTSSATAMASIRLEGLARELRCLAVPLIEGRPAL